jgi:protein-S-isoprenylcysteine O-methyltransferase Ste14
MLALFIERPTYPLGRSDMDILFDIVGIICALLGQTLRIVTVGYEYIERGGRNRQVYASKLVQGGVFGHCRNPLYVGNILIALGFALIVNSYLFYLIVVPFIVFSYSCIVTTEEAFLSHKFGAEYDQYCRRVNRWWPRLNGWKHSTEGMKFNWRRVLVKEYNTIFIMTVSLIALRLWCDYWISGPGALPRTEYLMIGAAAWLVLYVIVRSLKKSGYVKA